jgi:hypothetical protein
MPKGKSADFAKEGIESLPKNKPIVYKIENRKGDNIYAGVAKRGRVEERLEEHLTGGRSCAWWSKGEDRAEKQHKENPQCRSLNRQKTTALTKQKEQIGHLASRCT